MNPNPVSPGITGHGAPRAPILTENEQAAFDVAVQHHIPEALTHLDGSPTQRLVAFVRDVAMLIESNGFFTCASDCGSSWPMDHAKDAAADRRVLVVGAGPNGTDAVCCSSVCADAVVGVRS